MEVRLGEEETVGKEGGGDGEVGYGGAVDGQGLRTEAY